MIGPCGRLALCQTGNPLKFVNKNKSINNLYLSVYMKGLPVQVAWLPSTRCV